jgi:hypothetical protein
VWRCLLELWQLAATWSAWSELLKHRPASHWLVISASASAMPWVRRCVSLARRSWDGTGVVGLEHLLTPSQSWSFKPGCQIGLK